MSSSQIEQTRTTFLFREGGRLPARDFWLLTPNFPLPPRQPSGYDNLVINTLRINLGGEGRLLKNCLILLLCLAIAGCHATGGHSHHKGAGEQAAIQRVMEARSDIRQVISHVPRTPAEMLAADQDPGAEVFSVDDYVKRLRAIPLKGCPEDFQKAFVNYVEAWNARAAANPGLCLRLAGGSGTHDENNPDAARRTESAWQTLQQVVAKHVATKSKNDGVLQ